MSTRSITLSAMVKPSLVDRVGPAAIPPNVAPPAVTAAAVPPFTTYVPSVAAKLVFPRSNPAGFPCAEPETSRPTPVPFSATSVSVTPLIPFASDRL